MTVSYSMSSDAISCAIRFLRRATMAPPSAALKAPTWLENLVPVAYPAWSMHSS